MNNAMEQLSLISESGGLILPADNVDWKMSYQNELLEFPNVKHDDQCDATSQFINHYNESKHRGVASIDGELI